MRALGKKVASALCVRVPVMGVDCPGSPRGKQKLVCLYLGKEAGEGGLGVLS